MSATTAPKLYYFGIAGRGEFVRLLLEDKAAKYEFVPFGFGEHVKALGDKMPFGQLPVWEEEGHFIAQTGAIVRHVAKKNGYYPADAYEAAHAEMVMEGAFEVFNKFVAFHFGKSCTKEDFEKFATSHYTHLEKILKKHKEGQENFTSTLSFADFAVFQVSDILSGVAPDVLKAHPLLADHHKRIASRPNIEAYLKAGRNFASLFESESQGL